MNATAIYIVTGHQVEVDGQLTRLGKPVALTDAQAKGLLERGAVREASSDELRLHGLAPEAEPARATQAVAREVVLGAAGTSKAAK